MKVRQLFRQLLNRFSISFKRFPVSMFMAVTTVAVLIALNHSDALPRESRDLLERLGMVLAMGFPMTLIVHLYWEKIPGKRMYELISYGLVAALLVLAYFFLIPEFGMVQLTRYSAYSLVLYLVFLMVPFRKNFAGFEAYVVKLFTAFFVTYLYSAILYGGLALILAAIDLLFNANIPSDAYFDIFLIVAGIVAPAVFLAEVPRDHHEAEIYEYSKILKVLLLYIVMPLLVAYAAILYAYFIRLLIIREWPINLVSHLVVWYGIITVITIFLAVPLRKDHGWARNFSRWMPIAMIAPFAIMYTAIFIRINAYGVTERRFFLLVTALWLTGAMIHYVIRYKKAVHLMIVLTLAAVAFLSVTGPWSGYSVSQWSQSRRYEQLITAHQLRGEDGRIVPNALVPENAQKEISSILLYFERYHDFSHLDTLPDEFETKDMASVFGFELVYDYGIPWEGREYFYLTRNEDGQLINIDGYQYMTSIATYQDLQTSTEEEAVSVNYHNDTRELVIISEGIERYRVTLAEMTDTILGRMGVRQREMIPRADLTFTDETETVKVLVAFRHINGFENRSTGTFEIEGAEFEIYFTIF
jgi:hypothetical protein